MPPTDWNGTSRRELLKYAAGTGAVASLGGVTAGRRGAAAQASSFELFGVIAGWEGRAPEGIAGETNPTLELVAGQSYAITWENGDGNPHSLVIVDGDGNELASTEVMDQEGETRTLEFTATEEMAEYFCGVHPSSMRGSVEVSAEGGQTADGESPIHPAFGFPALSDDVEPPVEPDHVVEARTVPRDDRPDPEFFFTPTGLFVEPGDTVRFSMVSPFHNVMAYHPGFRRTRRVPEGVPPISSPLFAEGAYWLYTFDEPGVYDLYCGPHEFLGMAMRVVAGEATGPGAEEVPEPSFTPGVGEAGPGGGNATADNETADEASDGNETADGDAPAPQSELAPPTGVAAAVLRDDALDPENVIDAGTVSWDDLADESKEPRSDE